MKVFYVKMRDGTEYIGQFEDVDGDIELRNLYNPFQLVVTREGRHTAMPVPAKQLLLDLDDVLTWGETTDEAAYNYHKQIEAMNAVKCGLVVPPSGIVAP